MYRFLLKPLLFLLPPERAHGVALGALEALLRIPGGEALLRKIYASPGHVQPKTVAGLEFPNPVGLAAGFDKNGRHIRAMAVLGFGFIEVGTVTPRPQAGNPRPRLFRLPADRALINRMGFNNDGLDALVRQLEKPRPAGLLIGGNIGKNKDTPNERAADDYVQCFEALFPHVDYFAVNVSSPNTPNLRELQDKEPLTRLLQTLQQLNSAQAAPKPVFLKIAPDLSDAQLDDIVAIAKETGLAGLIATNTTISREGLRTPPAMLERIGAGGLSGAPVRSRSTEIVRYLRAQLPPPFAIIAVGGINGPEAAKEKLDAGADLVQLYTGFVFEGPGVVSRIKNLP
jgi:dihydroorotate dehydrogenase